MVRAQYRPPITLKRGNENLVIMKWAVSSVGRASPLQGGGRWFEPNTAHHFFLYHSIKISLLFLILILILILIHSTHFVFRSVTRLHRPIYLIYLIYLFVCLLGGFISSCDPCSVLLFIGLNYFCAIRG